jgi:pimeloyl-ACP methyl ester carboxylesterase
MISLKIVVLGATGKMPESEPIMVFQGGPGQSVTELASFYAEFFDRTRKERAILLMDARGTGGSNPLRISPPVELLLDDLGSQIPASWAGSAREQLAMKAELKQYHSLAVVRDAHEVTKCLGYSRVNLYGTSYGTRCVLLYLRQYPDQVRSVVLKNIVPPDAVIPLSYAANSQRAFDLLADQCAADPACVGKYPDLRAEMRRVIETLEREPARVEILHPLNKQKQTVTIDRAAFAMLIRNLLMTPATRVAIPALVYEAGAGHFDRAAEQAVKIRIGIANVLYAGMSLSVIASEDVPRMTEQLIREDAADTFLGRAAADRALAAVRDWPRADIPATFFEPFASEVPALLVSGALDPATPPQWGERVAKQFPHGRHYVFASAAHPQQGFAGLEPLIAEFFETGSATNLKPPIDQKAGQDIDWP